MTNSVDCARIDCTKPTSYEKPLCYPHWQLFDAYGLFECDKCHRFEEVLHDLPGGDLCWDCARSVEVPIHVHKPVEYQKRHLYILKLDGGKFYIGQTNDLELRLREHQDGLTRSTAGKKPRLVYFEEWHGNRQELIEEENRLTLLNQRNPRAIRRIVIEWQRLIRLVDIEE